MDKREFRADKLYKLAKITVLIVTIILLWNTYTSYVSWRNVNTRSEYSYCQGGDTDFYRRCYETIHHFYSQAYEQFKTLLTITIFLPAFFFGGTWFYKYIFPVKK